MSQLTKIRRYSLQVFTHKPNIELPSMEEIMNILSEAFADSINKDFTIFMQDIDEIKRHYTKAQNMASEYPVTEEEVFTERK